MYLRELLDARVRKTVEGYNRALSILKDRFGKESEIVKAYVKEILDLPYTPGGNPKIIHEFYEKLSYSVQSLETIKSLHEVNEDPPQHRNSKRDSTFQTQQKRPRKCVYCQADDHKPSECGKITSPADRKEFLTTKKLCFNYTGPHKSSECQSTSTCQTCGKRHHTSICGLSKEVKTEGVLTAHQPENKEVVYPIVLVEIDGIKTHALLDTGAGSSYASAKLNNLLNKRPKETATKRIDMMLGSSTTNVEIYSATLGAVDGKFDMNIELTKVHKPQLLTLDNPNYEALLSKYSHLKGVKTSNSHSRSLRRNNSVPWTCLAWPTLMRTTNKQSTKSSKNSLRETYPAGWYETKLPWKANHPTLPTNEAGSKRKLDQLIRKLERNGQYEEYDSIIQDQLQEGIVEPAPETPTGKELYVPHKEVNRENAESTKLRIVYDASAREKDNQPSLNDCLHPGPPLQNRLWDILVRWRFYPVLLTGDLKKASFKFA
ncbi:hypothetical protein ACROYT_G013528 [Oculina patagonica]